MQGASTIYRSEEGRRAIERWCSRELARIAVETEHRTVPTALGEAHAICAGDVSAGPPVLLLPGTTFTAVHWRGLIERLSPRQGVLAADLPGQPGWSATRRPPFTERAAYARWLVELLDGLGLDQVFLVGHSLGGWVSLVAAAAAPERLAGVILVCPAGIASLKIGLTSIWRSSRWLLRPSPANSAKLLAMMSEPGAQLDDDLIEWQALVGRHVRTSLAPPPLPDETLLAIEAPTSLIVSELDVFLPGERVAEKAKQRLPALRDVFIAPGGGHLLPHDRPELLAGKLLEHLETSRRSARPSRQKSANFSADR